MQTEQNQPLPAIGQVRGAEHWATAVQMRRMMMVPYGGLPKIRLSWRGMRSLPRKALDTARGGDRPGADRPKGSTKAKEIAAIEGTIASGETDTKKFTDAMACVMDIINDPTQPVDLKARLTIASMPFQHPRAGEALQDKKSAPRKQRVLPRLVDMRLAERPAKGKIPTISAIS